MGTDIHLFVEKRTNGVWHLFDIPRRSRSKEHEQNTFTDRNYTLFGLLAGVRNYEEFTPIAGYRGFPEGCSLHPDEYEDYHSRSWASLRELVEYDWKAIKKRSGYLTKEQIDALPIPPISWTRTAAYTGISIRAEWEDNTPVSNGFLMFLHSLHRHVENIDDCRILFAFDS